MGQAPRSFGERRLQFLGQALFCPSEARLEVYVEDPLVAVMGNPEQRTRCLSVLLLWWLSLSLEPDLSWAKCQRVPKVQRIGCEFRVESNKEVVVTLPAEFITKLIGNLDTSMGIKDWSGDVSEIAGTTELASLRLLAGRTSWAAGVVSCFGAVLQPPWAVINRVYDSRSTSARKLAYPGGASR